MVKIIHEIDKCIGCGSCVSVCPNYWTLKGNKSKLKGGKKIGKNFVLVVKEAGCNREAESLCPVNCIHVQ